MPIASPSAPSFSAAFCCTRTDSRWLSHIPSVASIRSYRNRRLSRLTLSARLNSSKSSGAGGFVWPENSDLQYELQHGFASQRLKGSPVYVTLPVDAVGSSGQVRRRKAITQSFRALAAAGVEGVVMEVWWGLVERDAPRVYDWKGYLEIVALAKKVGLRVRAVMAFHQCGTGPGDPY